MTKQDIYNTISASIMEQFSLSADKITPSLNFLNDIDADSIDFVELVLDLEDHFDVEIPDEDAEKLVTLQSTVDYIADKKGITA
ncbi:acyl carrier protein [Periweissella ghanensis]|uniref:Acyl carrier protein n=1 Tax=Periweissella ghanensis TaxID=467997 RepID=A0ABM8ZA01_9LACO|nr:acyl carrier protein [Periweissella ghanensis]MCM0601728.1 acyl carrier protein [Periweissella ghanensis]CAH0418160.1 Acyl carrier protein [Periweissella ghanensis]